MKRFKKIMVHIIRMNNEKVLKMKTPIKNFYSLSRKERGILLAKSKRIKKIEGGWLVPSQFSDREYFVSEHGFDCTCPDCQKRNTTCKHAFAVQYYLQKITTDKSGAVKIETKRLTYPQAWHAYNQAQTNEVNMFDKLLCELVESVEEPKRHGVGRPSLSLREQLFCSTQKVYSQLSSRRAKSLFNNAKAKGLLVKVPHSNSVNKFFNREDLTPILHKLIALSSAPLKSVETSFAIDSTGFRTTKFNEYCKEKHGTKKEHAWIKLHAVCGTKTNIITACEVTPSTGKGTGDTSLFEPLSLKTKENGFNIQEMSADKAYNSIDNCNLINSLGGTAFIPYRTDRIATVRSGNRGKLWRKMYHYFKFNQEEFMQHYHARSNIESTFNMIKAKFGDLIKSKNWTAQKNELLAKVLCHNIVVLIHEMYELGIEAKFN